MTFYKTPQDKIDMIIGNLISEFPFYGRAALYLHWDVKDDLNPPTAATNGKSVFFHPDFLKERADGELIYVAIHEIEHVVRKHIIRKRGRDHLRWNIACDHSINTDLDRYIMKSTSKLKTLNDLYKDPKYLDWVEEDIYNDLDENVEFKSHSTGMFEGDSELSEAEEAEEHRRINRIIEAAAKAARDAGKLPGHIERLVAQIREPKVNWKQKLRMFLSPIFPREVSWARLNKRAIARQIYMPGINKTGMGKVAILVDTSGSVSDKEISAFINEMNYIIGEIQPEETQIIYFESYPWLEEKYYAGETLQIPSNVHRGGTNFQRAFEEIKGEPKVVICLTDMYDSFSFKQPACPTLWVATSDIKAPWGETIKIEIN